MRSWLLILLSSYKTPTTQSFEKYKIYHGCAFIAGFQHKPNLTPHYQKFYRTIYFLDRVHFIECKHRQTRIVLTYIKENSKNISIVKTKWINVYTSLQFLVAKVCMHLLESVCDQAEVGGPLRNMQQKFIFRQKENWFKQKENWSSFHFNVQCICISLSAHSWLWKYLNLVIKQFMRRRRWGKRVKCNI